MIIPKWNIEEETGYKPFTTFWQDFSIATHTACKPFKIRSTVPLMSGKKITNTLLNLYLFLIIRFATIMLRMAQMKKMIKLIFTINFGMKPTTTH